MEDSLGKLGDLNVDAKTEYQKAKATKTPRTTKDLNSLDEKIVNMSSTFNPNQIASMLGIQVRIVKEVLSKY